MVAMVLALMTSGLAPPAHGDSSGSSHRGTGDTARTKTAASQSGPQPVSPVPQSMKRVGPNVSLGESVYVVADDTADAAARKATVGALRAHHVKPSVVASLSKVPGEAPAVLITGTGSESAVEAGAARGKKIQHQMGLSGATTSRDEGYVLATGSLTGHPLVMLQGNDGSGSFYAAQTLRQLLSGAAKSTTIPGVQITDSPAYSRRGVIEGFYGKPWSDAARLSQMDFYGRTKMNSYVYSPKDDEYLRAKWRQKYPDDKLAVLKKLIGRAKSNHVDFTYALSPGLSVCYSSSKDLKALNAKLQSIWDIGVRSFSIPLDDISYTDWNCKADKKKFGTGGKAAGKAQSYLLNKVQKSFIDKHPGADPLQMVPTKYFDVKSSPYKSVLADELDSKILVGWTGVGVAPATITSAQAADAKKVFNHKIVLWDNYPVNDYKPHRLLMGPYVGRQSGMSSALAGITANPMRLPEPSRIALFNVADFTWNDRAYQPKKSWQASLDDFAGDHPRARKALESFADLNYASRLDDTPAPELARVVKAYWKTPTTAKREKLQQRLQLISRIGPELKKIGDKRFEHEAAPWTTAAALWGKSARAALDAYTQIQQGHSARARAAYHRSVRLEKLAKKVTYDSIDGPLQVKIGHKALDAFVEKAQHKYQDRA